MTKIDAQHATQMFPFVRGEIRGADLWSGFAVLDMGPKAYGVVVAGQFLACSEKYSSAKRAGEVAANRRLRA